jgi:hypothetical protein
MLEALLNGEAGHPAPLDDVTQRRNLKSLDPSIRWDDVRFMGKV